MRKEIVCIACSIFRKEIEEIQAINIFDVEFKFLDSMLHMNPEKLSVLLNKSVQENSDKNIILLYGDCEPEMHKLEEQKNIYRSPGINCCNITLANSRYKRLRNEGAFILMDEWVGRWEEVFKKQLGFNTSKNAKLFMREMHTKLVYLDTGKVEVPITTLENISTYFGLPYQIEKASANNIISVLEEAINRFNNGNR